MRANSRRIEKLSVSDAIRLQFCERQVGFARDGQFDSLKSSNLYTHLGDVIHQVVEDFASFPAGGDFRSWFESTWEMHLSAEYEKYSKSIFPLEPRRPEAWPNLTIKKVELGRSLKRRLDWQFAPAAADRVDRVPLEGVEVWLPSRNLDREPLPLVYGRIDAIRHSGEKPLLVDLKTGDSSVTIERTRMQLSLYSYLYEFETGLEPVCARQDVSGNLEWLTDLSSGSVHRTYEAVEKKIQEFNSKIAESTFEASVNESNCTLCDYRVVCDDFKASNLNSESLEVIQGEVARVIDSGRMCTLELRIGEGRTDSVLIHGLDPSKWAEKVGFKAFFTGLSRSAGSETEFRINEFSRGIAVSAI